MASKNNNGVDGEAAFLGVGVVIIGTFLFALLAFLAAICTALALFALWRPLRLWKWTIEPETARLFLTACLLGTVTFVVFTAFTSFLFDFRFPWDFLKYIMIGGYIAGACCVDNLLTEEDTQDEPDVAPALASPTLEHEPAALSAPPFRFASWSDEEELK